MVGGGRRAGTPAPPARRSGVPKADPPVVKMRLLVGMGDRSMRMDAMHVKVANVEDAVDVIGPEPSDALRLAVCVYAVARSARSGKPEPLAAGVLLVFWGQWGIRKSARACGVPPSTLASACRGFRRSLRMCGLEVVRRSVALEDQLEEGDGNG